MLLNDFRITLYIYSALLFSHFITPNYTHFLLPKVTFGSCYDIFVHFQHYPFSNNKFDEDFSFIYSDVSVTITETLPIDSTRRKTVFQQFLISVQSHLTNSSCFQTRVAVICNYNYVKKRCHI